MLNYGYTRCIGTDVSVNATFKHHIVMFSATYQDDRNRTNPGGKDYNDFVAYAPRWSFSVKVGYRLRWFTIEAECQNVFDKPYEMIQRWPMPGRRYAVTMKCNL